MDEARKWRWIDMTLAVVAAVVVAYGVLFLGWSVFVVIALFWLENVVIGVFNVAKMLISGVRMGVLGLIGALWLTAFFTVHYGMFTVVHGVFVVMLFGKTELGESLSGLTGPLAQMLEYLLADRDGWVAAVGITVLQAAAFIRWWSTARTDAMSLPTLMFAPYGRIIILHLTVLAGGMLVQMLNAPVAGALLLVALKLAFDITAANTAVVKRSLPAVPWRRFIVVRRKDDATRP